MAQYFTIAFCCSPCVKRLGSPGANLWSVLSHLSWQKRFCFSFHFELHIIVEKTSGCLNMLEIKIMSKSGGLMYLSPTVKVLGRINNLPAHSSSPSSTAALFCQNTFLSLYSLPLWVYRGFAISKTASLPQCYSSYSPITVEINTGL